MMQIEVRKNGHTTPYNKNQIKRNLFWFLFFIMKGEVLMNEKLYYITDCYGSCYGINNANKLVIVSNESLATKFTLTKANNLIQNCVKPMMRYQYILKEVPADEKQVTDDYAELSQMDYKRTRFDEMDTEWNDYVEDVISFGSQLRQYAANLNIMLSEVDKEICDIMHFIEFNSLDAAKGYRIYRMLHDCRLRRRKIKDEKAKTEEAIKVFADCEWLEKTKKCLIQMKTLDNRTYTPRILTELFEEAS